jgi:predicted phage terminase large subunit-like protein
MIDSARLLRAALRQNLSCFTQKAFATLNPGTPYRHNWHIDHLCHQLSRVERGELTRLIINVPPRSLKSITASIAFPAWVMGRDPTKRIICASYSDAFARKLAIDAHTVVETPWYQELFPRFELTSRKPSSLNLMTSRQGYRFTAGMGGSILGRGADLIVVDDPIKPTDALSRAERLRVNEAFDSTLFSRLDDKSQGAIVIIMQRLHEDDLVGHVLSRHGWELVTLPAVAVEDQNYRLSDLPGHVHRRLSGDVLHASRESRDTLDAIRKAQGSLTFSAQYQQAPIPPEGNIVKREWLHPYRQRPDSFDMKIASWDTASTLSNEADYSVGTVWGAKGLDFYLLDLVRGRFEFPELRREVIRLSQAWQVNQTIIEATELGRALLQDLRRSGPIRPTLIVSRNDKEARFVAQSARFESGQVHVPNDAPWLAEWLNELLAFPNGRHDDQVDSTSQALKFLYGKMSVLERAKTPALRRDIKRRAGHAQQGTAISQIDEGPPR